MKADPALKKLAHLIVDPASYDPNDTALAELARREGVASVLYHLTGWEILREYARTAAARYAMQRQVMGEVQAHLTAASIEPIWLKGVSLAESVYPVAHARQMVDIDVWVGRDAIQQAIAVLTQHGFTPPQSPHRLFAEDELPDQHHVTLTRYGVFVEVHFHLIKFAGRVADTTWFQGQTHSVARGDFSFRAFTPEAHLLYLAAHAYLHHGASQLLLKHYLDVHFLVSRSTIDWECVVTAAVRLRWAFVVGLLLTHTRNYFQTEIPDWVLPALDEQRSAEEDLQFVLRMQTAEGMRSEKLNNVLRTLPWSKRWQVLWRVLFPPPAFMRQYYRLDDKQNLVPFYTRRLLTLVRRSALALWQHKTKIH